MSSFKTVAVLGAGFLGSAITEQLAAAGFDVTVLSRNPSSIKSLPSGVKVAQVDYDSEESLKNALKGQDVTVVTFGIEALPIQHNVLDASIAAGVKRYIPADWGAFTTDPKARHLPVLAPFLPMQDSLQKKAEAGEIEYTIFSVGAFLDYVIDFPFILDLKTHSAQIYDNGKHALSATSVSTIGKAVAGALKKPGQTKNRNLFIHEATITQSQVIAIAKKYSPQGTEWTETHADAKEELQKGLEAFEKDPTNLGLIHPVFKAALLGGQFTAAYPKVDNELVGVPMLSEEDLEKRFASKF